MYDFSLEASDDAPSIAVTSFLCRVPCLPLQRKFITIYLLCCLPIRLEQATVNDSLKHSGLGWTKTSKVHFMFTYFLPWQCITESSCMILLCWFLHKTFWKDILNTALSFSGKMRRHLAKAGWFCTNLIMYVLVILQIFWSFFWPFILLYYRKFKNYSNMCHFLSTVVSPGVKMQCVTSP